MSATLSIYLGSFDLIKKFESAIANMKGKFALCSGRYVVEARSVMGILSMDISRPIQLRISDSTETDIEILRQYCIQDTQI